MSLDEGDPIHGLFLTCGEAVVSRDLRLFAVNCLFCNAIFMELPVFSDHILQVHPQQVDNAMVEIVDEYESRRVAMEIAGELTDPGAHPNVMDCESVDQLAEKASENSQSLVQQSIDDSNDCFILESIEEYPEKDSSCSYECDAIDVLGETTDETTNETMKLNETTTTKHIRRETSETKIDSGVAKKFKNFPKFINRNNSRFNSLRIRFRTNRTLKQPVEAADSTATEGKIMESEVTESTAYNEDLVCSNMDLKLIELYKQQTCLWDLQDPEFSNKSARLAAYSNISASLNREFFAGMRYKEKINKLRMRIARLCEWYKQQLRLKYRSELLGKKFKIENEMHFKKFEFLRYIVEPSMKEEEEEHIRHLVEEQNLKQDLIATSNHCDFDTAETNEVEKINVNSDHSISIACTTQERVETTRLIEAYMQFPILWNPELSGSSSFKEKREALEKIATILTKKYLIPMNSDIVRQKIKNLRQQYKDYLKKGDNGTASKLWYIPLLESFLSEHINKSMRRLNRVQEVSKKSPAPLDLPFRYEKNYTLNITLIEALQNSTKLWQNKDKVFKVSTDLTQNAEFQSMLQILNNKHSLQLDQNNLLMLLHDLCEWFKREKAREVFCQEEEPATIFTSSSPECWEKMQFLADYFFLPDEYVCEICNKTTKSIHRYLLDWCRHEALAPHKCFYCPKRFVDITNCRTHECRMHSKIFNHTCEFCDKKFAHGTDALIHKRRFHTHERPYVCELCGKGFVIAYDMKRHRNWHLKQKDFKCNLCDVFLPSQRELKVHIKRHANKGNNTCSLCEEQYASMFALKKHILERHVQCTECHRPFMDSDSLQNHMRMAHFTVTEDDNSLIIEENFETNNIATDEPMQYILLISRNE